MNYNDKLKLAKEALDSGSYDKETIEYIFPELKESESDRIRKALIHYFDISYNIAFVGDKDIKNKDIIAWLEKQKVLTTEEDLQGKEDVLWCIKQAKKHAKDENEMGTCWFAEKWFERQGEQKSLDDIAKEVTKDKNTAISFLKSTGIMNENGELADEYKIEQGEPKSQEEVVDNLHNYLYGEQKPAWSEEDKEITRSLLDIIYECHSYGKCALKLNEYSKLCNWLKSLKDRYTWKPSDEQMDALHDAAVYVDKSMFPYPKGILMKLYEQLKKLKEK